MNLRDQTTDQQANEKGKWFDYDGETSVQIAAHLCVAHRRALEKLGKKYQAAIRKRRQEELDQMTIEAMADGLVLDWKGLKDGDTEVPCTRENKIRVLTVSRPFREWVAQMATDTANFLKEQEAADEADLKSGAGVGTEVGG